MANDIVYIKRLERFELVRCEIQTMQRLPKSGNLHLNSGKKMSRGYKLTDTELDVEVPLRCAASVNMET